MGRQAGRLRGNGTSIPHTWGTTREELEAAFPCDRYLPEADEALFRAVDVAAPARVVFRWLCQLRAAPYSYDWIDNFGRTSPPRFTPGLERLEVGQRVMTFFELVEFEPDRHLTVMTPPTALDGVSAASRSATSCGRATRRTRASSSSSASAMLAGGWGGPRDGSCRGATW